MKLLSTPSTAWLGSTGTWMFPGCMSGGAMHLARKGSLPNSCSVMRALTGRRSDPFPAQRLQFLEGHFWAVHQEHPWQETQFLNPRNEEGKRHHQLEIFLAVRRADGHQAGRARVFCQPPWSTLPPHVWCCEGEDQGQRWEEEQQEEEDLISLVVDVVVAANRQVVN